MCGWFQTLRYFPERTLTTTGHHEPEWDNTKLKQANIENREITEVACMLIDTKEIGVPSADFNNNWQTIFLQ